MQKYLVLSSLCLYGIFVLGCTSNEENVKTVLSSSEISAPLNDAMQHSRRITIADKDNSLVYYYSNDSICYTAEIDTIWYEGVSDLPDEINVRLTLSSRLNQFDEMVYEAVAKMSSPTESFLDPNEPEKGDYWASDYIFRISESCRIRITLDTVKYEACVVAIYCHDVENTLRYMSKYLKRHPDYDVFLRENSCE